MDAAKIAMYGFGRVKEMGPRSGGGKRGGEFLTNESGLADADHNHAAGAEVERIDRVAKVHVQSVGHRRECLRLQLNDFASIAELFEGRQRCGQSGSSHGASSLTAGERPVSP